MDMDAADPLAPVDAPTAMDPVAPLALSPKDSMCARTGVQGPLALAKDFIDIFVGINDYGDFVDKDGQVDSSIVSPKIFPSSFVTFRELLSLRYRWDSVERETLRMAIFDQGRLLVVPINIEKRHWFIALVRVDSVEIEFLDSVSRWNQDAYYLPYCKKIGNWLDQARANYAGDTEIVPAGWAQAS
ncbi:hypothetical protein T484DRAFT_1861043 [Baffinella frigidus]|nr:hypothetical protein T484DRAFT_1861043 [Cryptophyta sp. CCMP2293]